jgi:hypothetical protein
MWQEKLQLRRFPWPRSKLLHEPQETLDACPFLLFPPLHSYMGCWNQTTRNVATSIIKHRTPVDWLREANLGSVSSYPKIKFPEAPWTCSELTLQRKEQYAPFLVWIALGPVAISCNRQHLRSLVYYIRRQEDGRDLATFGINAVCFLYLDALTLIQL